MTNYKEMKTVELRKIAQGLGIKGYASGNKAFLIPAIEKAEADKAAVEVKSTEEVKKFVENFDVLEDDGTVDETVEEVEEVEAVEEEDEQDDEVVETEKIVRTINDWIFRSLPKYVQKAIDYCDYVDGVYCIHLKTEAGEKEVANRVWREASREARSYCRQAK